MKRALLVLWLVLFPLTACEDEEEQAPPHDWPFFLEAMGDIEPKDDEYVAVLAMLSFIALWGVRRHA